MEIQSYPIDFVNSLRSKIVDGLEESVKQTLLPLKKENSFTIYNITPSTMGQQINETGAVNNGPHTNASKKYESNSDVKKPSNLAVTNKSEDNAWRSSSALVIRKPINPNENTKKKELFLLLNKISESNFQIISKQLISLIKEQDEIDNSLFSVLITRLFQSAMIQVSFCPIYAKICSNLILELDSQQVHGELDTKITKQLASLKDYSSSMELSDYESFCDDVAFKNRYIGCYHFITELLNNKCLPFNKIVEVLEDLDNNIKEQENSIKIDILVESICKIYQSIDRRMLQDPQIKEADSLIKLILEKYHNKMSSRAKYIFEDVLEKKLN